MRSHLQASEGSQEHCVGVYFRALLIGYCPGISTEHGGPLAQESQRATFRWFRAHADREGRAERADCGHRGDDPGDQGVNAIDLNREVGVKH
jgi:hypothetical protein